MTVKVAELFSLTWKHHWSKPRYQKSRWAKEVEKYYRNNIDPTFGQLDLKDITPKVIRRWLDRYEEKPYAGNRSLEVLSRMFTFAEEDEIIAVGSNPCRVVKSLPEMKRERFATEEELQKILAVLERMAKAKKTQKGASFLLTLLLTGSRPIAIKRAKRSDIRFFDVDGERWGIIEFIGKSSHTTGKKEKILFAPKILELIDAIYPPFDGSLFGVKKGGVQLWQKVIAEAGCPDLWSRDLRRTFATVGMSAGVDRSVVGELLNHKSAQTTMLYAKLMDSARITAVQTISGRITEIGKTKAS